jgi:hypothetical protein
VGYKVQKELYLRWIDRNEGRTGHEEALDS